MDFINQIIAYLEDFISKIIGYIMDTFNEKLEEMSSVVEENLGF